MDEQSVAYTYNKILFRLKKGRKFWHDNMDEPWGHYTKWNTSDKEGQISYDFTYVWHLKNNSNKQKAEIDP